MCQKLGVYSRQEIYNLYLQSLLSNKVDKNSYSLDEVPSIVKFIGSESTLVDARERRNKDLVFNGERVLV